MVAEWEELLFIKTLVTNSIEDLEKLFCKKQSGGGIVVGAVVFLFLNFEKYDLIKSHAT